MKKIARYFPVNKILKHEIINSLVKAIGIYLGVGIGVTIISNLTDWIPLVKNFTFHISNFYGYYALAGIALGIYQYVTKQDLDDIEFVTLEDIKAICSVKKVKAGLLIATAAMCIIPSGSTKKIDKPEEVMVQTEEQVVEEVAIENVESQEIEEQVSDKEEIVIEEEIEPEVVEYVPAEEKFVPGNLVGLTEYPGIEITIYDNGAVVTQHVSWVADIYIPSYVKYDGKEYPVKAIGDEVFSWDPCVYKIIIPDTVTTIGENSIQGCQFLDTLHLGNNLTYVGGGSIMSNEGLDELYLPATLYEIGEFALEDTVYKGFKLYEKDWRKRTPLVSVDGRTISGDFVAEEDKYTGPLALTEDQMLMRDFILDVDGMNIHYQHNGFMDVMEVNRETTNGHVPEKYKPNNIQVREYDGTNADIYFTTEEVYNEFVGNAAVVTDYGCYIRSFDFLSNVILIPCDGFVFVYNKYDYEPDLKNRTEEVEKEIFRTHEISQAFSLTNEVNSDKNILNMVVEKCKLGNYKIKSKDDIYSIEMKCYVDENSKLLTRYYISNISFKKEEMPFGYLLLNDEVLADAEKYGYTFMQGVEAFCATFNLDWHVVIVEAGQGPDLSKYPKNYQELSSEEDAQLHSADFFVSKYFTLYKDSTDSLSKEQRNEDMISNLTIDAFKEYFELNN